MDEQLDLFATDGPDGRLDHFSAGAQSHPTHAVIENIGQVRISGYHGNGYFHVVDAQDNKRFVHRDRLTFLSHA